MSSRNPKPPVVPPSAKILMQYRSGLAMVYELDCKGSELNLRISPDQTDTLENFRVEARSGRESDAACVDERGATRRAALQNVARVWRERRMPDLPNIDWDAVDQALFAVRAV